MADDSGLFHEIDEALRIDNMEKLLRKYGKLVLAGCVGIVVLTAGSVIWKNHVREKNMERTSVLIEAHELASGGKYADAGGRLEGILKQSQEVPVAVELQYAGILLQAGKTDEAKKVYSDIQSGSGDKGIKALAAINASILASNGKSPEAPQQTLDSDSGQPFYDIIGELTALRLAKEGKTKEAHDMLENIAADMTLSQAAHQRAIELLNSIRGDKQ